MSDLEEAGGGFAARGDTETAGGRRDHEPWLAVVLSSLLVGAGQFYSDLRLRAVVLLGAYLACLALGLVMAAGPLGDARVGLCLLLLSVLVFVANLLDAHRVAAQSNSPEFEADRRRTPDPWRAVFLSRILPGLGHVSVKKRGQGALVLVGTSAAVVMVEVVAAALGRQSEVWGNLLIAFGLGYVSYISYFAAPDCREKSRGAIRQVALLLIAWNFLGSSLPGVLRARVTQAFRMRSESMLPTIRVGDCLFVWKLGCSGPRRGEIIAFHYPPDPSKDYFKRVIAIPGDRVEIRDKVVFVNGRPLEEHYVAHIDPSVRPRGFDQRDNFGPVTIPAGGYFVLGDNRDNSNDSRFFGDVSRRLLVGHVTKIYWPPSRISRVR